MKVLLTFFILSIPFLGYASFPIESSEVIPLIARNYTIKPLALLLGILSIILLYPVPLLALALLFIKNRDFRCSIVTGLIVGLIIILLVLIYFIISFNI